MTVKRKAWGSTTNLVTHDRLQVELIRVNPLGYCSHHYHQNKENLFWVIEGELTVKFEYMPDSFTIVTMDCSKHPLVIPAKMKHQFINLSNDPVVAVEAYRPVDGQLVDPEDIVRFSEGGSSWSEE